VVFLGVANGAFSIAAIATMMRLAGEGGPGKEGTRMGLWGAAQAIAFGLGGIVGTAASDIAHAIFGDSRLAYLSVFIFQAMLFMASALVAYRMRSNTKPVDAVRRPHPIQWREGSAT
jgi:BCD family chlorophyll transporter-like MFS transporter